MWEGLAFDCIAWMWQVHEKLKLKPKSAQTSQKLPKITKIAKSCQKLQKLKKIEPFECQNSDKILANFEPVFCFVFLGLEGWRPIKTN